MKKKTKIALITVVTLAVLTAVGVMIYQGNPPDMSKLVAIENKEESKEPEVVIDIRTEREKAPEYKEIVDEETGDKVMAEVQINEPIEQKPATPPEKPKSEGSYTNHEQPPTYTKEQTVIEEKPKNNVTPNSNKNQSSSGKVYIEGFGYVEKAGQTKTQTGVSNGDINKMVGSMD